MAEVYPAGTAGNMAVSSGGPGVHVACDAAVAGLRVRAEAAEAKLAAIITYCQAQADEFNATMPMRVRPQDMRISAGDILDIISGEETRHG